MAALGFAFIAGLVLARRMVGPIQALRAGAARIGSGDLGQRISVKTGDELEGLADQFNDMAGRLQESYADLEEKVEIRTHELAQSVAELRALGEVSQAVNSTLDLNEVLNAIVTKAVQLSETDAGAIYDYDEAKKEFGLRSAYGMDEAMITAIKERHVRITDPGIGQAALERIPVAIADVRDQPASEIFDMVMRAGSARC
jgi:nitrate/nitrite-specific signal transduction histidine kinase